MKFQRLSNHSVRTNLRLLPLLLAVAVLLAPAMVEAGQSAAGATGSGGRRCIIRKVKKNLDENDGSGIAAAVVKVQGISTPDGYDEKPLISADGSTMFFTSARQGNREWAKFNAKRNRYDYDIYMSSRVQLRTDREEWSAPVNIGAPINSSGDEEFASISPDGQSAYFISLKPNWESDGGPYYAASLKGAKWSGLKGLGGGITEFFEDRNFSTSFRVYGASISPDGKDFYFATTLHSNTFEQQIWVSHCKNGVWGYPENVGPVINSASGSCAPYMAADGKTLFFASTRAGGYGGDDIYASVNIQGEWQDAENVGAPINTAGDDEFLSVPAAGNRVYFSSTRDGKSELFMAPLPEILRPGQVVLLSGTVTDNVNGKPMEANIIIEDLQTGITVYNANSNAESGRYTVVLQPGHNYGISMTAPGHGFASQHYTIASNANYKELQLDLNLGQLKAGSNFTLNNLFYDYNSDALRPESRNELNRLIKLLRENPSLKISVCGHTDSIGSDHYNEDLSMRRANSVRDYVAKTGVISSDRIDTKGFGSTQPVAPNSTEEGRQLNRRITFVIDSM